MLVIEYKKEYEWITIPILNVVFGTVTADIHHLDKSVEKVEIQSISQIGLKGNLV